MSNIELIKKIIDKYEMTGGYIDGWKRVDYKHFDSVAKDNMSRELANLLTSRDEKVLRKFVEYYLLVNKIWKFNEVDNIRESVDLFLKEKKQ